jgi:hypothetical protein
VSRARTENIVNGLLRFDWVYRLRTMLEVAGLPVTSAMLEREALLRACADEVRGASLVAQPAPRPTTARAR